VSEKPIELAEAKAELAPKEALVPIVVPPLSVSEILEHFNRIQELKRRLIDPESDIVLIKGKPYIKKSGWRKLAFAFNLSDEIVREEKEERPDGEIIYRIWTKVTAPNGRYVVAVGCASSRERDFAHPAHDPYALAATRSKNRAISDIIGLGELSAEELLPTEEIEVEAKKVEPAKVEAKPPEAKAVEQRPQKWFEVVWEVDNLRNPPLAKKGPYTFLRNTVNDLKALRGVKFQSEEDDSHLFSLKCAEIPEDEKNRFLSVVSWTVRKLFDIPDSERDRVKVYLKEA
jgi:hypothetical protein